MSFRFHFARQFFLKGMFLLLFSGSLLSSAAADIQVAPPDMDIIIRRIEQCQAHSMLSFPMPAKFEIRGNQLLVVVPKIPGAAVYSFDAQGARLVRHVTVFPRPGEGYAFLTTLDSPGADFQHLVMTVAGRDALVFFNDNDVIVYTQTPGVNGGVELKEWIYARKPNAAKGSEWSWDVKAEATQWPLSMEMAPDGGTRINRNVPVAGFPIDDKAKAQYMLNSRVKFQNGDQVKRYFPFSELVAAMGVPQVTTREGLTRAVDCGVVNVSVNDLNRKRPDVGLDLEGWDDLWKSVYKESVTAKPEEYPLLIEN